jgi:hypothetical protein
MTDQGDRAWRRQGASVISQPSLSFVSDMHLCVVTRPQQCVGPPSDEVLSGHVISGYRATTKQIGRLIKGSQRAPEFLGTGMSVKKSESRFAETQILKPTNLPDCEVNRE